MREKALRLGAMLLAGLVVGILFNLALVGDPLNLGGLLGGLLVGLLMYAMS